MIPSPERRLVRRAAGRRRRARGKDQEQQSATQEGASVAIAAPSAGLRPIG